VLLPAAAGRSSGPVPPVPVRPAPQPLDRSQESLDRCAAALGAAGLADLYPARGDWQPLGRLSGGTMVVTLLAAEVPFVCVTGPTTVEVSDPRAAVPVDRALLLLSTPGGVLAAVAPAGARVEITVDGEYPAGLTSGDTFLRLTPRTITEAGQLAVTVGDAGGVRRLGAPERLPPPALRVVDRRAVPADPSPGAADLLRRCLAEAGAVEGAGWAPAQVVTYRRAEQPASLLVAAGGSGGSGIGGCSVGPGEVTPLRSWGPGSADGARPFVWLTPLPDLDVDVVAGPVRADVVRMEVGVDDETRWPVAVGGGTFAGQAPAGTAKDPRALIVSAYAADDTLLYQGPAVG
jgi:hypothetical protein